MRKCKNCKHFIGFGDFGLCCELDYGLWYEDDICEKWEPDEDKAPELNINTEHPGPLYRTYDSQ